MTLLEGSFLVPFVVPVTIVLVWVLYRRGWPAWRLAMVVVFAIYLSGVAAQTLFPIMIGGHSGRSPVHLRDIVYLRLFDGLFATAGNRHQAFLNVVLGIPFGVLLPIVGVRSVWNVVVLGLLFAVGIEGLQLLEDVISRTEFRTVDINDVILNWFGIALGYAAFRLVAAAFGRLRMREPTPS